jgi:TonB-linked SusC/RagA family outer membrane protein
MNSMLRRVLAIAALLLVPTWLSAQESRVTGQVTAEDSGQPLAGVQIMVKGTAVGTLTDGNGNYAIRVPEGSNALVFAYLGYRTIERDIEGPTLNVAMTQEAIGVEGITVTALGIEREKRSLGYSVQDVGGEELTEAREVNLVNSLAGRVSGLQVRATGNEGGSSRVLIRGSNSLTGNNEPLFVVDGMPIDNSAPENDGYGGYSFDFSTGGVDYGNAAMDLNPNDIESISVLKGANAAALYGSRAANGAIVITTKKGRRQALGITASTNWMFSTPLKLPDYQNQYGQGSGGEFEYVDGAGGGVNDGVDESWGPPLDQGLCVPQWFSEPGQCDPWVSHPDNIDNFFGTGVTATQNVAFTAASEQAHARLSVTRMDLDGMVPGLDLARTSVLLSGGVQLTDRLSAEATVDYILSEGENRPGTGYDGYNPMLQFIWFGRQNDMSMLRSRYDEFFANGNPVNWNSNYHDNPYWITLINTNDDQRNRVIGNATVSYQLTDWLTTSLRSGTDWYRDYAQRDYEVQSVDFPDGRFARNELFRRETNTALSLSAVRDLTPDINLQFDLGGNIRNYEASHTYTDVPLLAVPGVFTLDNAAATPDIDELIREKQTRSVYGSANFDYRNFFFVGVTGRNDWSSTLPEENNSYFYPSVSTSLIFTDAFDMGSDLLTYGKLRASWARVGADTDPYQLAAVYASEQQWGSTPIYTVPAELPNALLKPEETESFEVGTELGFLNQRLGLDFTYYNQVTRDQIISADISAASGFTTQVVNAGAIRNQGVELLLNATPIETGGFRWQVTANYAKNDNEVESLLPGVENLVIGNAGRDDYWGVRVQARVGEPYGQLVGEGYKRDAQGRILVDDDGFPLEADTLLVLGNYNPDWTGGITNTFSYRGVDFSFQFDTQQGGDIFSVTNMFGNFAGVLDTSLEGRENGYCDPGVLVDGIVESTGEANTNRVCPEDYFFDLYFMDEPHVYDASFVKLREVKLGFNVPESVRRYVPVSSARLTLVGRNLWLGTDTPHIDPETAFDTSNRQGFEFGQLPTPRSFGFDLSIQP